MPKFEKLNVWKRAIALAVYVYKITSTGELSKDFGLRDQMRRAVVSIAGNIAEGDEMDSDKQSIKYFRIAKGSSGELYTHTEVAFQIGYIKEEERKHIQTECVAISGMLGNLIKSRKRRL